MIRKIVSLLLAIAICLSLAGCGNSKPDSMTEETYKLGKETLKVMDKYLAGKLDADTAEKQLSEIMNKLEEEGDALQEKADAGDIDALMYVFQNSNVCFNVSSFVIGMYGWDNPYGNTYDCGEIRDSLASALEAK